MRPQRETAYPATPPAGSASDLQAAAPKRLPEEAGR